MRGIACIGSNVLQPHFNGGLRHELRDAARACRTDLTGVKPAFLPEQASEESDRDVVLLCGILHGFTDRICGSSPSLIQAAACAAACGLRWPLVLCGHIIICCVDFEGGSTAAVTAALSECVLTFIGSDCAAAMVKEGSAHNRLYVGTFKIHRENKHSNRGGEKISHQTSIHCV